MGLDKPRGRQISVIYPRPSKGVMVTLPMNEKVPKKGPAGRKNKWDDFREVE